MAGSFSSKKVARAARTGGGRRSGVNANLSYYALLAVLILGFTALLVHSRNDRLAATTPNNTPPLEPTASRSGDQWYEAYGVYVCDKFLPNINSEADPYGLATRNDGIIHIHPYEKQYAGKNATIGLFADAVQMKLGDDFVQLPSDPTEYRDGVTKCGDKNAVMVVKEWTDANNPDSGTILDTNPRNVRVKDNAAITIAFVPEGEKNIPLPPSAPNLNAAREADAAAANAAAQQQQQAPVDPAAGITPVDPAATPADPAAPPVDPAATIPAPAAP